MFTEEKQRKTVVKKKPQTHSVLKRKFQTEERDKKRVKEEVQLIL